MKGNFQRKLVIFLVLFCFWLVKPTSVKAQCELKFKHWIEDVNNKPSEGDIFVSLEGDVSSYTFKLYDLFKGKVIKTRVVDNLQKGERFLLFDHVPASTYTIYVNRKDCENHTTLGGQLGLIVGQ